MAGVELYREEDYNWTTPIIGMSIALIGGTVDSFGKPIGSMGFYIVGKHKNGGKTIIAKTDKSTPLAALKISILQELMNQNLN